MADQLLGRFQFDVPIREKQPTEDGNGTRMIVVGKKRMNVEVVIDASEVENIARVAAYSKSRRSKSGPVVAKAREVRG